MQNQLRHFSIFYKTTSVWKFKTSWHKFLNVLTNVALRHYFAIKIKFILLFSGKLCDLLQWSVSRSQINYLLCEGRLKSICLFYICMYMCLYHTCILGLGVEVYVFQLSLCFWFIQDMFLGHLMYVRDCTGEWKNR